MVTSIPYWCRILVLITVIAVIVAVDWHRHGPRATKPREYGFVILTGIVGSLFGLFNDLLTSSISPDYFIFGKGLAPGNGFTMGVAILGMKAGFSAGAIAGAICLFASTRKGNRAVPFHNLLGLVWKPVVLAVATAFTLALFFRQLDPLDFSGALAEVLDPQQICRFLMVWWIHLGLYLSLLVSVPWMVVDITRLRRRTGIAEAGPEYGHGGSTAD